MEKTNEVLILLNCSLESDSVHEVGERVGFGFGFGFFSFNNANKAVDFGESLSLEVF